MIETTINRLLKDLPENISDNIKQVIKYPGLTIDETRELDKYYNKSFEQYNDKLLKNIVNDEERFIVNIYGFEEYRWENEYATMENLMHHIRFDDNSKIYKDLVARRVMRLWLGGLYREFDPHVIFGIEPCWGLEWHFGADFDFGLVNMRTYRRFPAYRGPDWNPHSTERKKEIYDKSMKKTPGYL